MMNKPTYQVQSNELNSYFFTSIGKRGLILKVVDLVEIDNNVYNLGFGDYDFSTGTVNDLINSDNGDAEKVLATIVGIIKLFLNENPDSEIFLTGSTPSRTRLYQMAINIYFDELSSSFEIMGGINEKFEPFQKNRNYESFIVKNLF